jgi:hypothetical protein
MKINWIGECESDEPPVRSDKVEWDHGRPARHSSAYSTLYSTVDKDSKRRVCLALISVRMLKRKFAHLHGICKWFGVSVCGLVDLGKVRGRVFVFLVGYYEKQ